MDIGCNKSAINRRPAIHTHAWFSNKHALTDAYAMTLNPKTSVPATSAQDMNKSSKKFRSQGARKELCRAGFAAAFVCISSLHWPRPDPVCSCGLCPSSFWPCCVLRAAPTPVAFPAAIVSTFAAASHWKIFAYAYAQWVSPGLTLAAALPWPHNALSFVTFLRITCPGHVLCKLDWPALTFPFAASSEPAQEFAFMATWVSSAQ